MRWLTLKKAAFCALRPTLWKQLAYGVAPAIEHTEALRRYQFRTVVDVGANRGQFATFARRAFSKAQIYSFEPLLAPARIYRRILQSDKYVHLFNNAIGGTERDADIYVTTQDDSSSFLTPTRIQKEVFRVNITRTERVTVRRLSDCITATNLSEPALLKIDVQGGELDVLQGSSDLLPHFDVVYVECSYVAMYEKQPLYTEVASWMTNQGFHLAGVFNQHNDTTLGPIQAVFLFVRAPSSACIEGAAS